MSAKMHTLRFCKSTEFLHCGFFPVGYDAIIQTVKFKWKPGFVLFQNDGSEWFVLY